MNADLINPFISSTINVLTTMCQTTPKPGKPALKVNNLTWGVVTGLIGMAGDEVTGNLMVSFDERSILELVSKLLSDSFTTVNQDVIDAVGEITNMICGGTKQELNQKGYKIQMATPLVLAGKDLAITQLGENPTITVPFKIDAGEFVVEASLAKR